MSVVDESVEQEGTDADRQRHGQPGGEQVHPEDGIRDRLDGREKWRMVGDGDRRKPAKVLLAELNGVGKVA